MRLWMLPMLPAVAVTLASCDRLATRDLPPANCPRVTILQDGADLTRFRDGAGQDLSVLVADARIQGLNARCDYAQRGAAVSMSLAVEFEVERGPAARGPVTLPWFVVVTRAEDESVVERRTFEMGVTFPANISRTRSAAPPVRMTFPIRDGRRVTDYNVRVSFQLTEQELAYNRRRGPR